MFASSKGTRLSSLPHKTLISVPTKGFFGLYPLQKGTKLVIPGSGDLLLVTVPPNPYQVHAKYETFEEVLKRNMK